MHERLTPLGVHLASCSRMESEEAGVVVVLDYMWKPEAKQTQIHMILDCHSAPALLC